jgi:AhpD family alkylhydroperoxidase
MTIVKLKTRTEVEDAVANQDHETRKYVKMMGDAPYIRAMGYKPNILRNMALSSKHGNPTRHLPRKVKEMIASTISMLNGCKYCVTSHTGLLKGVYGLDDEEVVELAAVVRHINGLNFLEKAAQSELFKPLDASTTVIYEEIRREFGTLPEFLKLVSADAELLSIIWDREKVTMHEGKLERWVKELIALYISVTNGCYENARIRMTNSEKLKVRKEAVIEGLWVAERFNKNTKITEGLLLETSPEELLVLRKFKDQL